MPLHPGSGSVRMQRSMNTTFESKDLVTCRLNIAPATVRTHLQRVRVKYAAAGRPAPTKAALVARAVQDGIISIDDL